MKNLITHWKTTVTGILVALVTILMMMGNITIEQWGGGIGTIATIVGLLAKDWDKTDQV